MVLFIVVYILGVAVLLHEELKVPLFYLLGNGAQMHEHILYHINFFFLEVVLLDFLDGLIEVGPDFLANLLVLLLVLIQMLTIEPLLFAHDP